MVPPSAQGAPPPQLQQMQAEMANKKAEADAKTVEAKAKMAEAQATAAEAKNKIDVGHYAPKQEGVAAGQPPPDSDTPADTALAQAKLIDADSKSREVSVREREVAVHEMEAKTENQNRDLDRADKMKETAIGLAGEVIRAPTAGESGKQVSTDKVGKKTRKIIADVDKGLK
jgi:multidrug resistance efflux pump